MRKDEKKTAQRQGGATQVMRIQGGEGKNREYSNQPNLHTRKANKLDVEGILQLTASLILVLFYCSSSLLKTRACHNNSVQ